MNLAGTGSEPQMDILAADHGVGHDFFLYWRENAKRPG
jgi:hypothetical protein